MKKHKYQVVIEVLGGVVGVKSCPKEVAIKIIDYDILEDKHKKYIG